MNSLYKVVPIVGKGLGCVALKDIKKGTIILEEKSQMNVKEVKNSLITDNNDSTLITLKQYEKTGKIDIVVNVSTNKDHCKIVESAVDAFNQMDVDDKTEFWKLYDAVNPEEPDFFGIFNTNNFGTFFGIKASRFNHSCQPNAEVTFSMDENKMIRIFALTKIKKGQEIMILYGDRDVPMRCREERRSFLRAKWKFDCHCQLCEAEESENDDATYHRFKQLKDQVEVLLKKTKAFCEGKEDGWNKVVLDGHLLRYRMIIDNIKEMYGLAKKKKPNRSFIMEQIITIGFQSALSGFTLLLVMYQLCGYDRKEKGPMAAGFREDCKKFGKVGLEILKLFGVENGHTENFKESNENFYNFFVRQLEISEFVSDGRVKIITLNGKKKIQFIPFWVPLDELGENFENAKILYNENPVKPFFQ